MAAKSHLAAIMVVAMAACGGVPGDYDASLPDADPADADPPDADPPDASPPDAEVPIYDCEDLPAGPLEPTQVGVVVASEDIAFDAVGNAVGADDHTIYKTMRDGSPQVFVPNIEFRAGMRFLPNGDLVVANDQQGTLIRVDPDGVQHLVLAGLSYPNGLTVDPNGMVYLTEHDAGQIRRIDPMTGDYTIIATGLTYPNGITFNAVYNLLYVGTFSGEGTIYTITIDSEGSAGPLTEWAKNVGSGWLDGMGVDACGNVYICDYGLQGDSRVYRIAPNGTDIELLIDKQPGNMETRYLPNLQWGPGFGGWSQTAIYLPDGWDKILYEVEIGVPGKPRVYP